MSNDIKSDREKVLESNLADKTLLYLGATPSDAVMTFAEDGSTHAELVALAKDIVGTRSPPSRLLDKLTQLQVSLEQARELRHPVGNVGVSGEMLDVTDAAGPFRSEDINATLDEYITRLETPCPHENFMLVGAIDRITDGEGGPVLGYYANMSVSCTQCQEPFHFKGLPYGLSPDAPHIEVGGLEARMPIAPGRLPLPESGTMIYKAM